MASIVKKKYVIMAVIMVALLGLTGAAYVFLWMYPQSDDHDLIPTYDTERFFLPINFTENDTVMEYLRMSGDYLTGKIKDDGMWVYQYDPETNKEVSKYNILRHAGTTYSLALIFKYTQDLRYYNGTINTLNYLMNERLIFEDMGEYEIGYIEYRSLAKLGGVALTLLGLTEVMKIDPEVKYQRELDAMGNFMLMMQYDNGKFQCFYKTMEEDHNDYYPGEALLALAKIYELTGEQKYLDALELSLDFYNDYYKAGVYTAYTPWATEAMAYAHRWLGNDSYLDMCYKMANSCKGGQNRPGSTSNPLNVGGWGGDPQANGASRIEGVIDSYLMAKRTNDTDRAEEYLGSSELCGTFLYNLMLNESDCRGFPNPRNALGGTPLSYGDPHIRIDYVQHAVVVMVKIMVYANTYEHI